MPSLISDIPQSWPKEWRLIVCSARSFHICGLSHLILVSALFGVWITPGLLMREQHRPREGLLEATSSSRLQCQSWDAGLAVIGLDPGLPIAWPQLPLNMQESREKQAVSFRIQYRAWGTYGEKEGRRSSKLNSHIKHLSVLSVF